MIRYIILLQSYIWTARVSYSGDDRLDITVKGNDPLGSIFAPTWAMVMEHKKSTRANRDTIYTNQYVTLLNQRFSENPEMFEKLYAMDEVTLVCFCAVGAFCHRVLLAKMIAQLGKCVYIGER